MSTLSCSIIEIILHGVAPIALRTPISLVRSFTAIIMMLLTPTIPAIRVPIPMTQMNTRIFPSMSMMRTYSIVLFHTLTASSSSGSKLYFLARRCLMSFAIFSLSSTVAPPVLTQITLSLSCPLNARCAVLTGMYIRSLSPRPGSVKVPITLKGIPSTFTYFPTGSSFSNNASCTGFPITHTFRYEVISLSLMNLPETTVQFSM